MLCFKVIHTQVHLCRSCISCLDYRPWRSMKQKLQCYSWRDNPISIILEIMIISRIRLDELLIIQRYILEVYNSRFYMKFRYQINRSFQQSRYLSYSLLQRKITYSLDLLNLHELCLIMISWWYLASKINTNNSWVKEAISILQYCIWYLGFWSIHHPKAFYFLFCSLILYWRRV